MTRGNIGVDRYSNLYAGPDAPMLFILRADARALHKQGKLQKIDGKSAYCAPRSWRQIAHDIFPSLPREALELSALKPTDLPERESK